MFFLFANSGWAQIEAIKGLAEGGAEIISGLADADACASCCWDNGTLFFIDLALLIHKFINFFVNYVSNKNLKANSENVQK